MSASWRRENFEPGQSRKQSVYLSKADLAEIAAEAERLGKSRSYVVALALRLAMPTIRTYPSAPPKGTG